MEDTYGLAGKFNEAANANEDKAVDFFNSHIEEVIY
jgi:hypothetical protein